MKADGNFILGEWTGSGSPQESSGLSSLNLGELKLNNTIVVDGSRNLTNIGTVNCGVITVNGTNTIIQSASTGFNIGTSGSSFFGTLTGQALNASAYGININSTEVISSARQLKNISSVSGNMNFLNNLALNGLTFAQRTAGDSVEIGMIDDDDEVLILKGFGASSQIDLGDGTVSITGNTSISGSLSKTSGSFKIDHPLKPETHHLVHSFVESPQADNLYRGVIELKDGRAVIDLDEWFGMTPGTFLALNRDLQAFVSNEEDWDAVRAKVMGSHLVIECQNARSKASVSWMVVGERQDNEIYESTLTDDYGKIIVEPEKKVVE
jgi:hypothetical protein